MRKILFFTYDFPYPINTGGKSRAYNLIKFAKNGVEINLFSFIRDDFKREYIDEIKKIGVKDVRLFKRRRSHDLKTAFSILSPASSVFRYLYFDKAIERKLLNFVKEKRIDIVHFESYYTAFYISEKFNELGVKQIFGTENIEYINYRDYARYLSNPILRLVYFWEASKIEKEEENLMKRADVCLAVTGQESSFIKKITEKKCYVVENGVDLEYFEFKERKSQETKTILFVGNFSYFPNLDAIRFFYFDVFTKFKDTNIRFIVVGKSSKKLLFIKDKRVELIEFVPDIRSVYNKADIMISPVRIGGGTNFKILESMAVGLPIVAHPARLAALGAKDNIHLLFAEDGNSFVHQINRLLEDNKLAAALSKNARNLVEEKFSWEKIGKKMNKIWKEI